MFQGTIRLRSSLVRLQRYAMVTTHSGSSSIMARRQLLRQATTTTKGLPVATLSSSSMISSSNHHHHHHQQQQQQQQLSKCFFSTLSENINNINKNDKTTTISLKDSSWKNMTEETRELARIITGIDNNNDTTTNNNTTTTANNNNNNNQTKMHRRVALSRAITLMESKNSFKKHQADLLLTYLLSHRSDMDQNEKNQSQPHPLPPTSLRVGFAGPPGAGKSSLIEAFGMYLLENYNKTNNNKTNNKNENNDNDNNDNAVVVSELAVVCIDPSSGISGGSILGDKTRMTELSRHDRAYVRPSSNSGVLGGLAAYTDDVVSTLHAAGYPLIFVETVGLGQSEIEIIQSVDVLVLLLPPGGGDELQGVKKGIVELAQILAVTKADGNLLPAARSTAADYRGALRVLQQSSARGNSSSSNSSDCDEGDQQHNGEKKKTKKIHSWQPPVLLTSSVTKDGLDKLWESIQEYQKYLIQSGEWENRRKRQSQYWMWKQFTRMMQERMQNDPILSETASTLESELLKGHLTPRVAAQELLDSVFHRLSSSPASSSSSSSSSSQS